jgi:D-lactate dehydrogenase
MGRVMAGGNDPLLRLAERAGVILRIPEALADKCCGLPFHSKGFPEAGDALRARTVDHLRRVSEEGRLPIIVDGSSCTHAIAEGSTLDFVDSVTFARETLLPHLTIRHTIPDLALHVSCGAQHLGIGADLRAVASAMAVRVVEPSRSDCCGFAGDRGFSHPELTASATAPMAAEIRMAGCTQGATSNLPCGIGMARATGIPFRHLLEVLEEVTR